mmetsp:Transcript_123732/g.350365  ORF Transcript_123732/g.350365 Transcript_123732/m.350365 type:complete len:213 (+) Transcript_123732:386-1024(+)
MRAVPAYCLPSCSILEYSALLPSTSSAAVPLSSGLSSRSRAPVPPSAWATAASMKTHGRAARSASWPSIAARVMVQTCCPTVTQQFSNAICSAVLTSFPSAWARLFSVATRPKGMAKEPVSGITEAAMQATANAPWCPTTKAARVLTTAPTKMQGAYTDRGRSVVFSRSPMMTSAETSCSTDLHWPPKLNAAMPSAYASFSGDPSGASWLPW